MDAALCIMVCVFFAGVCALIAWLCVSFALRTSDLSEKDQTTVVVCVTLTMFIVVFASIYCYFYEEVLMCSN